MYAIRSYYESHRVLQSKPHKQHVLVRLAGLESLDAVQPLVGRTVFARCRDLPELSADEHYWHELEGLAVIDQRRGPLGTIAGLFATGAHEIPTVDGEGGEILIPYLPQFVLTIDLAAGQVLRITSYNVCYTKLLRSIFRFVPRHSG